MAQYRNFHIECTILPDAAGQYEAAFSIKEATSAAQPQRDLGKRYDFPPVGSYMTPDDAREQTEAWARKWVDANFG